MPFYEYQCGQCEHHLEVLQKVTDKPLRKCPACGKSALKKLMSAPVFRLKGSGWYETDFKSDNESKRNIAGADKEDKPATETPGDAKADASKAETTPGTDKSADKSTDQRAGKADSVKPDQSKSVDAKTGPAQAAPAASNKSGTSTKSSRAATKVSRKSGKSAKRAR